LAVSLDFKKSISKNAFCDTVEHTDVACRKHFCWFSSKV